MKQLVISLVVLLASVALVQASGARQASEPQSSRGGAVQSWQYAGVDRSTIAFSTAPKLCFAGEGVVIGFVASSNTNSTDFIVFRDTQSVNEFQSLQDQEFARVYLSTGNRYVGQQVPYNGYGTTYSFPAPIRVTRGLAVASSAETINLITILHNAFGKDKEPN